MSGDLNTILSAIARNSASVRAVKRSKSHEYPNNFAEALRKKSSINIVEEGSATTNYFCGDIGGVQVVISPLASHEGWWEKPSEGFASMYKRRSCKTGIVLLELKKTQVDGFWIAGQDWELFIGHYTKINLDNVERAERKGIAHRFIDFDKFLELVSK